jgi:hypothetical protein
VEHYAANIVQTLEKCGRKMRTKLKETKEKGIKCGLP